MNKHQAQSDVSSFVRQWLEHLLTECRKRTGFLFWLRKYGHLHNRSTSLDINEKKFTVETFLRIEVNLAMKLTPKEFSEHWSHLGNNIYTFANDHGDEFNEQYARPKREQSDP